MANRPGAPELEELVDTVAELIQCKGILGVLEISRLAIVELGGWMTFGVGVQYISFDATNSALTTAPGHLPAVLQDLMY